jgi:hypothetical protein
MMFSSDVSKNGSFTSPDYPEAYPEKMTCNYRFTGSGKERIQISFSDFDLYQPPEERPVRESVSLDRQYTVSQ